MLARGGYAVTARTPGGELVSLTGADMAGLDIDLWKNTLSGDGTVYSGVRVRRLPPVERPAQSIAMPRPTPVASEDAIRWAIREIYTHAQTCGLKPPNLKQIAKPVQDILKREERHASAKRIETIAGEPSFAACRRDPGKRVNGTFPAFTLEGWKKSGVER